MLSAGTETPHARVLLVDDDARLTDAITEYLAMHGFDPSVEGRGDRAVERILADGPDLVVLDVMLPGEDGFSICERVRAKYRGPIIMLTGRGGEDGRARGLALGADEYLEKPVRPRVLLDRIRALLAAA